MSDAQTHPAIDPSSIMQLATAYWGAQTLFTANRLGIFTAVDAGMHTVAPPSAP